MPERVGNWKTVYNRFRNWAQKDCWAQIFREQRIDVDETASIATASCFNQAPRDRRRKGAPIHIALTPGERHEMSTAREQADYASGAFVADTGYDSNAMRAELRSRGIKPVIHSKPERKRALPLDRQLYRIRYLVEVCFHELKHFCAMGTRYEKTKACFLGLVQVDCICLWLN